MALAIVIRKMLRETGRRSKRIVKRDFKGTKKKFHHKGHGEHRGGE